MDKFTKITAPAGEKFRQLQKMVHEIKSNDGGFMQKIKRFQNDQVAGFCKTGKDAWDRITNKPPPSVPRRDYGPGPQDDENDDWSDEFGSDYENPDDHSDHGKTYVDPTEDPDENYEPPPNEPEPRFTPSYKFTDRNGGYAEKDRNRQPPSTPTDHINRPPRPLPNPYPKVTLGKLPTPIHQGNRLPTVPKPLPKPAPATRHLPPAMKKPVGRPHQQHDEEDYVVPGDEEDDNYIEPTASPEPFIAPAVIRSNKPGQPPITMSPSHQEEPDLYEVPENEDKPSPPVSREVLPLPRRNSPPKPEPQAKLDDTDRRSELPMKPTPFPLPRNVKPKPPLLKPTPGTLPRDVNSNNVERPPVVAERPRISIGSELPPTPPSRQKPPETANRYVVKQSRHGSVAEQDAGVLNKEWYSSSCDRKAAEEALLTTFKDGSFLVRRSTGQDLKQPFTLVVFYKKRVYNIPVRCIESTQQYALGREKSGEEKFNSVAEIIENHQRTSLVLIDSQTNTKDSTKLIHAVKVP